MTSCMWVVALCACAVSWAAPVQEEVVPEEALGSQPEIALLRVKRTAETITYGNHQNTPRVKKAGPLPPLAPPSEMKQEEAELDKKASVQSEVVPAEGSPDMALEGNPAMEGVIQNMVQPAAQEDPTEEEENLQQLVGKEPEEEAALDSLVQQTEDLPPLTPPEPEAAAMEGKPEADYDYNRQFQEEAPPANFFNYDPYNFPGAYNFPSTFGRRKRSAPKEHRSAVQAEDMFSVDETSSRIKRDLPDEYYGPDYDYPGYEEPAAEVSVPDSALASAYMNALLEQPAAEEQELDYGYPQEVSKKWTETQEEASPEDPYEYEALVAAALAEEQAEQEEQEEQEEEEARERLAMLEYLYLREAEAAAEEAAARQQAEEEEEYESEMEKRSEPVVDSEYQEIVHNGQPGIFFPVKRQYLSMLPGVKRSTDFYPYSEGPDGRWGALVQSEVEKRRQEEMYDRLYRLAEALRGDGYSDDVYRRK